MANVQKIIKAKLADKSKLPFWYKIRINKCELCKYNSKNIEKLSVKEKAFVIANLGKDICTICGCAVADKAAEPTEKCSMYKKGLVMEWDSVDDTLLSGGTIRVNNLSPHMGYIRLNKSNVRHKADEYIFEYNEQNYKEKSEIKISISSDKRQLTNFLVAASCGCTISSVKQHLGTGNISIKYDTTRIGKFFKTISVTFNEGKEKRKIIIKIQGNIKN